MMAWPIETSARSMPGTPAREVNTARTQCAHVIPSIETVVRMGDNIVVSVKPTPRFFAPTTLGTATERVRVVSGRDASLSVHYVGTSLAPYRVKATAYVLNCHLGKSGRRELISWQLRY